MKSDPKRALDAARHASDAADPGSKEVDWIPGPRSSASALRRARDKNYAVADFNSRSAAALASAVISAPASMRAISSQR